MPVITLTTDFGTADTFVAQMKGVILALAPDATLVDVTHDIPPQDVLAGALALESIVEAFGPGTIHVAVVDPGVGSSRRAVAIQTDRAFFVGPDNGLLVPASCARGQQRLSVVHLTDARFHRPHVAATFHGRDVFAPVAAHLAMGTPIDRLGPEIDDPMVLEWARPRREPGAVVGQVMRVDRFGNLVTNITPADLRGASAFIHVWLPACGPIPLVHTYAAVAPGEMLAYVGSGGWIEIAVRNGHAADTLGVTRGTAVRITE